MIPRCPLCGFSLTQTKTPPFACTHPNVTHYSYNGEFGYIIGEAPKPQIEAKVQPPVVKKKGRDKWAGKKKG